MKNRQNNKQLSSMTIQIFQTQYPPFVCQASASIFCFLHSKPRPCLSKIFWFHFFVFSIATKYGFLWKKYFCGKNPAASDCTEFGWKQQKLFCWDKAYQEKIILLKTARKSAKVLLINNCVMFYLLFGELDGGLFICVYMLHYIY